MPNWTNESLIEGPAFDDALQFIADEAAKVVEGVDSAAAVVHRGPNLKIASSGALATTVDATQYRLWQGPCLHAFHTGRIVLLDLSEQDPRWPDFQAVAVKAGAHTVLSLPLRLDDHPIGSLNLYSRARGAFSTRVVRQAEMFARPSALRLSYVGVALHAVEAAEVVVMELQDRVTLDQAIGVLMGVHRDPSVERAKRRLRQAATDLGVSVPLAAARIIASPPSPGA